MDKISYSASSDVTDLFLFHIWDMESTFTLRYVRPVDHVTTPSWCRSDVEGQGQPISCATADECGDEMKASSPKLRR
jgi:hypothetical protein